MTTHKFNKPDAPVRYPTSQQEIDNLISGELQNIRFSAPIVYNPRLRASYGQTKTKILNGVIREQIIEIGQQRKPGKAELIDTIIHEEFEARIMRRAYEKQTPRYMKMEVRGEGGTHPYILPRIERYLRLKGLI